VKIIYEDKNLVVIDKPAGLVIHNPGKTKIPTLVDWLLKKYPEMKKEKWPDYSYPGIVHRLDKDTSGLLIIAKNPQTQKFLQKQFKQRKVDKRYLALVLGTVKPKKGKIIALVGRDQKNRLKQKASSLVLSWTKGRTRPAETIYQLKKQYHIPKDKNNKKTVDLSLLEAKPITGRMHQIRVHLKYLGYPIIGDQVYNTKQSKKISQKLGLKRQFLHAYKLKLKLPGGKIKEFCSNLAEDLQEVLKKIE